MFGFPASVAYVRTRCWTTVVSMYADGSFGDPTKSVDVAAYDLGSDSVITTTAAAHARNVTTNERRLLQRTDASCSTLIRAPYPVPAGTSEPNCVNATAAVSSRRGARPRRRPRRRR